MRRMGDEVDDEAPTELASAGESDQPTEFAGLSPAETQSAQAWALADDDAEPRRRFGQGAVMTTAAVVASLAVTAAAAAIVYDRLFDEGQGPVAIPPSSTASPESAPNGSTRMPPSEHPSPKSSVPAPPPPVVATHEGSPQRGAVSSITTYIGWTGTPCIYIRIPSGGQIVQQITCNPGGSDAVQQPAAVSGSLVGADPIMGQATSLTCRVMVDAIQKTLRFDTGTAGDGHDINCIIQAP